MPNTHLSETYLKRQELQAKFKVSKATIYRWTKEGNFPPKYSPRRKYGSLESFRH